jgi:TDG/mug DNA glycosylase family protein
VPRLTAADLEAARALTIDDVLPGPSDPRLGVLFCGINPGLVSAATGHHFGRPGNRFWPVLHGAGFTPRLLQPAEQGELRSLGLGITNMVGRATARADELSASELVDGGVRLRELVDRLRPAWLAVVGPQELRLGETRVWALPNPSGLNAHWSLPAMVAEFGALLAASTRD